MTLASFDMLLKGGTLVNHDGAGLCDVAVTNGRIADIGHFPTSRAHKIVDCAGLHILPGVIDSQVHFREPGATHKEDLHSGSRAAVAGGVTTVFEMPNTAPPTTSEAAFADKMARARGRMYCDFAFYFGATDDNYHLLAEMERLPGCCGIKVFMGSSTGSLLVDGDDSLERTLRALGRRAAFHSEDEARLRARRSFQRPGSPASHAQWRDPQSARLSTARLLALARRLGRRVHILHVSTADELPLLAQHKDIASFELTPQHLTLAAPEAYESLGTLAQMNPPLRDHAHRRALWRALANGAADVLGSDHAPHTLAEKQRPYPESPSGMPGVQTLVPVMLDHVSKGRLSLARFVDLTSHGPGRVFQLARKGRIATGYDADFTIVDLKARRRLTNDWIESLCGWTPFDGLEVTGWPVGTIIRGRQVMWEGDIADPPGGEPAAFLECLTPEAPAS